MVERRAESCYNYIGMLANVKSDWGAVAYLREGYMGDAPPPLSRP